MANDGFLVTISGAALSLLFYENVRTSGDQMGFLLGEDLQYVTKKVTDADRHLETRKHCINVQGIFPCSSTDLIYDNSGGIIREKIEELLQVKSKQIVGWYRFRQGDSLNLTLRDKIIHNQLMHLFQEVMEGTSENFIVCVLNYSKSQQQGTHKFRHVLFHKKFGIFKTVPLKVHNLGADSSRHDVSDYKPTPIRRSGHPRDSFTSWLEKIKAQHSRKQHSGNLSIEQIQRLSEAHLNYLVPRVIESDRKVAALEEEVARLRAAVALNREFMYKYSENESYSCGEPKNRYTPIPDLDDGEEKVSSPLKSESIFKTPATNEKFKRTQLIDEKLSNISNTARKTPYKFSYSNAVKKSSDTADFS